MQHSLNKFYFVLHRLFHIDITISPINTLHILFFYVSRTLCISCQYLSLSPAPSLCPRDLSTSLPLSVPLYSPFFLSLPLSSRSPLFLLSPPSFPSLHFLLSISPQYPFSVFSPLTHGQWAVRFQGQERHCK